MVPLPKFVTTVWENSLKQTPEDFGDTGFPPLLDDAPQISEVMMTLHSPLVAPVSNFVEPAALAEELKNWRVPRRARRPRRRPLTRAQGCVS